MDRLIELGTTLARLRAEAGLMQRELADRIGISPYTFVSQYEAGLGRIPPRYWNAWADAIGADRQSFAVMLRSAYGTPAKSCVH